MVKWVNELHLYQKNHLPISFLLGNLRKDITDLTSRINLLSCILWLLETHWHHSNEEFTVKGLIANGGQAEHQSVDGEQLYCTLFVFLGFYFSLFFSIIIIIIIFYFRLWTVLVSTRRFYLFLILFPILPGWSGRKWVSSCVVLRD